MVILPACTVVIATVDRPESLERVLARLADQDCPAAETIVVDASAGTATEILVRGWASRLPLRYVKSDRRSAAQQRNEGAVFATTPLLAFLDDDISFPSDHLRRLARVFGTETGSAVVGVSGRETGMSHPRPRGLLRCYYRLQAGYPHPTYGGRLFGVALNTVPCYEEETAELIPAEWLPSTCVLYRREVFAQERFPDFEEYSFMEDVHLSARMARHGRLLFHAGAPFDHASGTSSFKRNATALAQHRIANRARVARETLGLAGWPLAYRLLLHRLFVTVHFLRTRPPQWRDAIAGTWA